MRDKNEEILRAAERLFERQGYKNTSMAEIAKQAGISIGTLYAYFHGKKMLFQALERPELKEFDPEAAKRKRFIVKTALNTFAKKGFAATTMDEIAALCGFSKTILYQFFPSKDDLFAAIFSEAEFLTESSEIPFEASQTNLHDYLENMGAAFLRMFDDPERLSLMRVVLGEPNSLAQSGRIMHHNTIHKVAEKLSRRLARYADAGLVRKVDFTLAARSFFGTLYSFILTDRILCPSAAQFSSEQIIRFTVDLFLRGLAENYGLQP